MSRKSRKAVVAPVVVEPVVAPVEPVVAVVEPVAPVEPVLASEAEAVGTFEPTSRSIVPLKYRRLYAPNDRSCGDQWAAELRNYLYEDGETLDYAKLVRFARANDCWQDKYNRLNPGQVRMNVGNRLRAKCNKGHEVIWVD